MDKTMTLQWFVHLFYFCMMHVENWLDFALSPSITVNAPMFAVNLS